MKRFIIILSGFTVFSFVVSILATLCLGKIPELLPSSVASYKFLNGLFCFIHCIPSIIATGFIIGWSSQFGLCYDKFKNRFSSEIFNCFKKVFLSSILCVFIVTFCVQVIEPTIQSKLKWHKERIELFKEYKKVSSYLFEQKEYKLSFDYAKLALHLNPYDKESNNLLRKAEIEANKDSSIYVSKKEKSIVKLDKIKLIEPYTTYQLLLKAKDCLDNKDYFAAHYFSQVAINASSSKDINVASLKDISNIAWNYISNAQESELTEEQKIYLKKLEGYKSLLSGDNLKAYYIYKTLSLKSRELSIDPDVVRYLKIAEENLVNDYFYIDETFNLKEFEVSNDVYFKLKNYDNTTSVFFIKGITPVKSNDGFIQYLRGVYIYTLDQNGKYKDGKYVSYAKMKVVEAKNIEGFENKNIKQVPFLMFNSVDRNKDGIINKMITKGGYNPSKEVNYLILPIDYKDFKNIINISNDFNFMNIGSLFSFAKSADEYGFSKDIIYKAIFDKLFYPFFILVLFILLGYIAWNGRLDENALFKFKWILVFPCFFASIHVMYNLLLTVFRLFNFTLVGYLGNTNGLILGVVVYIVLLIIVSVSFLSRKKY